MFYRRLLTSSTRDSQSVAQQSGAPSATRAPVASRPGLADKLKHRPFMRGRLESVEQNEASPNEADCCVRVYLSLLSSLRLPRAGPPRGPPQPSRGARELGDVAAVEVVPCDEASVQVDDHGDWERGRGAEVERVD